MTSSNPQIAESGLRGLRLLALGDSYTIGEGVSHFESWPALVANQMRSMGIPMEAPRVIAKTGWTTDELLQQLQIAPSLCDFDFATLMIGVNNQYRGRSCGDFTTDLDELLQLSIRAVDAQPSRVLAISIPDWGVTPFAGSRDVVQISAEIDRFNEELKRTAEAHQVKYLDVTTLSRLAQGDIGLLAADGLHPGPKLHELWAQRIAAELTNEAKRHTA